ncbi:MAG: hypothetical protein A2231_04215 [Candidatus Firestonebacteria bacterium RIFOXYA2_FULL_40_8]|nr:MAG: hypothetical protein A2231_04215 [Candidatus Firestonebacteria bacterium RIFOXYA2_FULL_40_8]
MKKNLYLSLLSLLFLLFLLPSSVSAEKYILKDGTVVLGKIVNESETKYTVKTEALGEITFLKELVKEVVKDEGAVNKETPKVYVKPVKLSVMDFELQSSNPQYVFFGKGFAEFISVEMSKSRDVALIEREKRREIIQEQKFTLTGLVEQKDSIEIGKMLAASYLITGKIIDIMGKIVITYRVVDTETGLVIFDGKMEEDPGKYDYISAFIAKSVLVNFSAKVPADTELKVANVQTKPVDVAVNFSKAVNSYDKKDYDSAKKDLAEAKKLDPTNDAVKYYINKLFKNTTKFKVMPELYVSYQNPAFLSLLDSDTFFYSNSGINPVNDPTLIDATPGAEKGVSEGATKGLTAYYLPVLPGLGAGIEYFTFSIEDTINGKYNSVGSPQSGGKPYYTVLANNNITDSGVALTAGLKINNNISLGFGTSIYTQSRSFYLINKPSLPPFDENSPEYSKRVTSAFAYEIGIVLKDNSNSVIFDSFYAATNEKLYKYSYALDDFSSYNVASVLENTLSFSLNEKQTFLVLKQNNYLYSDVSYYIGNLTPAAEQWFFNTFSLRAGYEFTYMDLLGVKSTGGGYTIGLTLPFEFLVKLNLDVNYTTRQRPSRNLEGLKIDERILFITVSASDLFFGTKKK